jgi:hypothetical protein
MYSDKAPWLESRKFCKEIYIDAAGLYHTGLMEVLGYEEVLLHDRFGCSYLNRRYPVMLRI